jgi:hypothetical protein
MRFSLGWLLVVALIGSLLWPHAALADEPRSARVAIFASGLGTREVLRSLKAGVPPGLTVVDSADLSAPAGVPKKLVLPLDPLETEALRHLASLNGIDAFVVVNVQVTRQGRRVSLEVFDVSQPDPYQEHVIRLGVRPAPADTGKLADLTRALATVKPPPLPPPPPAIVVPVTEISSPPTPPPAAQPEPRVEGDPASSLGSVIALFDLGTRTFSYHDGLSGNLRPYTGAAAPAVALGAEVYFFGATHNPFLQNLGLKGDIRAAIGVESKNQTGTVQTAWTDFDILLRYRFPLGKKSRPPVLGFNFGYSREEFAFALASTSFPAAAYPSLRIGGDVRVPFGKSAITGSGAYLDVLSPLYIGQNFRSPKAAGVDASLAYSYQVAPFVEAVALGGFTRYFYSFAPIPGDAWVAGGAVDQMFHGQLGVRVTY